MPFLNTATGCTKQESFYHEVAPMVVLWLVPMLRVVNVGFYYHDDHLGMCRLASADAFGLVIHSSMPLSYQWTS